MKQDGLLRVHQYFTLKYKANIIYGFQIPSASD